jgi:hypothetical protein
VARFVKKKKNERGLIIIFIKNCSDYDPTPAGYGFYHPSFIMVHRPIICATDYELFPFEPQISVACSDRSPHATDNGPIQILTKNFFKRILLGGQIGIPRRGRK